MIARIDLDLIVGAPGKKVKVAKSVRPMKACEACDTALLKYTYNWVLQRDDLSEKNCPYCGASLKIIERERKYVPIELDFSAKDLSIEVLL
jgi:rRNA maturation endonuclease Nob1